MSMIPADIAEQLVAARVAQADVTSEDRRTRAKAAAERRRQEAAQRRAIAAEQARQQAEKRTRDAEESAEHLAPSVQRKGVTATVANPATGQPEEVTIRGPRVERDGVTFVVSNPIRHLVARGMARADRGELPLITRAHEEACNRLVTAWNEGGSGVGMGSSNWGETGGGGGHVPSGVSDAVMQAIGYQNRQRGIFHGAMAWLGANGKIVRRVVLDGADLTAFASEVGMDRKAAVGYLAAALDRLLEYFGALDRRDERPAAPPRIRSAIVSSPAK